MWNRFGEYFPGVPWKYIVEMDIGKPSQEEKNKIISKGFYDKVIEPDNIKQFPENKG
jgi:hypothetical protein